MRWGLIRSFSLCLVGPIGTLRHILQCFIHSFYELSCPEYETGAVEKNGYIAYSSFLGFVYVGQS